jgi:uncharacterized protein (TIGR02099 family)
LTDQRSPNPLIRFLSQLQALILTTLAVVIIATAVLVGVGRALLPQADALRPWLEEQLGRQLGQTVAIERISGQWPGLTPSLTLTGVRLGARSGEGLELDAARLEVHLSNLLDGDLNLLRLVVLGPELVLASDEQGRWGVEMAAGVLMRGQLGESRLPTSDVLVRDARLRIRPFAGPELVLSIPDGGVRRAGDQTLFFGELQPQAGTPADTGAIRVLLHHADPQHRRIEGWLKVVDQRLGAWLSQVDGLAQFASTQVDIEAWLDWSMEADSARLDLDFDIRPDPQIGSVSGQAILSKDAGTTIFQLDRLESDGSLIGRGLALTVADREWTLYWDELDLASAHQSIRPWFAGLPGFPESMEGRVESLELGLDAGQGLSVAAGSIDALGFSYPNTGPTVTGLSLGLGRLGDRLVIEPSGEPTLAWPELLDGVVEFDALNGRVLLTPKSLELNRLRIDSPVVSALADGWVHLDAPKPFLDLSIQVDRVGPVDPRPYLPHRIIPPRAMEWLDQSLVWVDQARGYVNLHMRAGTKTRDLKPGSYQAGIEFEGIDLDYWPDWPPARELNGQAKFIGRALTGQVDRGRLGQLGLQDIDLGIADLVNPELRIDLGVDNSDAAVLSETLSAIPFEGWQAVLAPMHWSGAVGLSATLALPFRRMRDWSISGGLALNSAQLALPAIQARFEDVSAEVGFSRSGIESTTISARLGDQPIVLDVDAGFRRPAWLEFSGHLNPSDLLPETAGWTKIRDGVIGRSDWHYRLEQAEPTGLQMHLWSSLEGTALNWPAPLGKPPDEARSLSAELLSIDDRLDLALNLGGGLQTLMHLSDSGWSIAASLGGYDLPLPAAPGLTIGGSSQLLDLDAWLGLLGPLLGGENVGQKGLRRAAVSLAADQFRLAGVSTGAGIFSVDRTGSFWDLRLESPEISGSLNIPHQAGGGRAIVADLSRLYLAPDVDEVLARELQVDPPDGQISTFSPAGLPAVSLVIDDFRRGSFALGRVRLEAHPVAQGLEMELLDVNGPDLRLQGTGRWIDSDAGPQARFTGRLSTPSLSAMLNAAGYDPGIEASRSQVDLDVQWPGAPWDFAMSRLSGQLDLSVSDGQIPEARPGAGRLLGLVSFNAIPRRLMLDFRDVFSPGMRFDQIQGRFDLTEGRASTDGLRLQSPAAVMTITGETDMATRQYDQVLLVEPGLGASLPVIGGLAGGPVGAAAGLVLQQLLDRPLREVSEVRYRITGPWNSPAIDLIDAQAAEPAMSIVPEPGN